MVHKIIWMLIFTQIFLNGNFCFADSESTLRFNWKTTDKVSSTNCMHLVEVFLGELRNIASDRVIELAAKDENTSLTAIQLQCSGQETLEVKKTEENTSLCMRFQSASQSFDPIDWVSFQKRYLIEPSLNSIAPSKPELESAPMSAIAKLQSEPEISPTTNQKLWQKWWFWTLVGGAALGAYAASRALSHNQSMNVEIH